MDNKFAIAVKCIVFYNDKILLLSKSKNEMIGDLETNNLDIPGGRMEYGESATDKVIRELKEETNLIPNEITLKSSYTVIRPDGLNLVILLYKCVCNENNIILSDEHDDFYFENAEKILNNSNVPKWIKDNILLCY